ncbi:MAG: hypothetical protein HYV25_02955 [Candidatus Harrisonbacteria bacterium]|nr:hypothetical protein [Candidatus Harrisonbacteria bacterium]
MKGNIVVIYHKDCKDGFGGAFAAWKKFGSRARYISYRHGDEPVTDFAGSDVYFIDLAYKKPVLEEVKRNNRRVVIIDHHETNADVIRLADEALYDIGHSGAVLAWTYFHPKKPVPKMLMYIEDTDMGAWVLPHTREIFSFIGAQPYDFNVWNKLAALFERPEGKKEAIARGKAVLQREEQLVKGLVDDAQEVEFEGYRCRAVNSPILNTAIGAALIKKYPPIAIIWHERGVKRRVSLRSVGEVDVGAIAAKYGGGGHKNAAGFEVPLNAPLPWQVIAK